MKKLRLISIMKKTHLLSFLIILTLLISTVAHAGQNLAKGSKGEDVRKVQQQLIDQGFLFGKADGDFGKKTEQAVMDFQVANGLSATGIVDDKTLSLLSGEPAEITDALETVTDTASAEESMPEAIAEDNLASDVALVFPSLEESEIFLLPGFFGMDSVPYVDDPRDKVNLRLLISLAYPNHEIEDPVSVHADWTDDMIDRTDDLYNFWAKNISRSELLEPGWNYSTEGKTSFMVDTSFYSLKGTPLADVEIYLPDDPSIEGRRYVEIIADGIKSYVNFTLAYQGDYSTGTGWELTFVSIDDHIVETPTVGEYDYLEKEETASDVSNEAIEDEEDGIFRDSDFSFETYGLHMEFSPYHFFEGKTGSVSVSWTDEVLEEDVDVNWDDDESTDAYFALQNHRAGRKDTTFYFVHNYYEEHGKSIPSGSSFFLTLPDDGSIAGRQQITLDNGQQRVTFDVYMTFDNSGGKISYDGGKTYEDIGGYWSIDLISAAVE